MNQSYEKNITHNKKYTRGNYKEITCLTIKLAKYERFIL